MGLDGSRRFPGALAVGQPPPLDQVLQVRGLRGVGCGCLAPAVHHALHLWRHASARLSHVWNTLDIHSARASVQQPGLQSTTRSTCGGTPRLDFYTYGTRSRYTVHVHNYSLACSPPLAPPVGAAQLDLHMCVICVVCVSGAWPCCAQGTVRVGGSVVLLDLAAHGQLTQCQQAQAEMIMVEGVLELACPHRPQSGMRHVPGGPCSSLNAGIQCLSSSEPGRDGRVRDTHQPGCRTASTCPNAFCQGIGHAWAALESPAGTRG